MVQPNVFDVVDAPGEVGAQTIASPDHQTVYAAASGFGVQIDTITPSGTRTPFFDGLPLAQVSGLAVATTGRVFVSYFESGSPFVAVISPAGALEATWPLPGLNGSALSVAADGCTLFYSKAASIGRFDACTGTALADFAAGPAFGIEVLPDGRVFVANGPSVLLYSAGGVVQQTILLATYGILDFTAQQVAISADGASVYIAAMNFCENSGILLQLSMTDASELSRRTIFFGSASGLVTGLAHAVQVPAASETALLVLAITLALAGVSLLNR